MKRTFVRRTTDLEKTTNIYTNWLPFSLSVTTSADVFLVTFGHTINYLLYNAIHERNQTSQDSNPPKVPQKPNFIVILNAWTWNAKCSYELEMWCTKILQHHVTGVDSGVERSGDARGDCLIGCPCTEFQCSTVVCGGHCYWIYAVLTSHYDVIFTFVTNVLAKFVDTTCIFSDAEAALRQGEQ